MLYSSQRLGQRKTAENARWKMLHQALFHASCVAIRLQGTVAQKTQNVACSVTQPLEQVYKFGARGKFLAYPADHSAPRYKQRKQL